MRNECGWVGLERSAIGAEEMDDMPVGESRCDMNTYVSLLGGRSY